MENWVNKPGTISDEERAPVFVEYYLVLELV